MSALPRNLIRPVGAPSPKEKGEMISRVDELHASPLEKLSQRD